MAINDNDVNAKVNKIINNLVDDEIKNLKKFLKGHLGPALEIALNNNIGYEIEITDGVPELYFVISDDMKFPLSQEVIDADIIQNINNDCNYNIFNNEECITIDLFNQDLFVLKNGDSINIEYPGAFLNFLKFEDASYIDLFIKELDLYLKKYPKCIIPKSVIKNRETLIDFFQVYLILS